MVRRLYLIALLLAFPVVLTGCPDDDQTLGEEIGEGVEELGDEIEDATDEVDE